MWTRCWGLSSEVEGKVKGSQAQAKCKGGDKNVSKILHGSFQEHAF
jgi:hypothetical protein